MTTLHADPSAIDVTADDRRQFLEQGFLGPLSLCSPDEMEKLRPAIEAAVAEDAPDHSQKWHNRHLDQRIIHDVSTHPAIIERMAALYGPDLLLWRTNFFTKDPGGLEIPWHQDRNYWPLEPPVIISAWLAIDPATVENSCVQVIPGSHRRVIPHIKSTEGMQFPEMADPDYYDESQAVDLEMQPGEFFLFNERTLHHSEPNRSNNRRMGLAVRVIVPIVQVLSFDSPNHKLVLVHGEDRLGFNPTTEPPASR